jgi:hypothetical protein
MVGLGGASVADEIILGGIVGSGVDSIAGMRIPAQAERRLNRKIEISFFTKIIICHTCTPRQVCARCKCCESSRSNLPLD